MHRRDRVPAVMVVPRAVWWILGVATAGKAALAAWLAWLAMGALGAKQAVAWPGTSPADSTTGTELLSILLVIVFFAALGGAFGLVVSTVQRICLLKAPRGWGLTSGAAAFVTSGVGVLAIAVANRLFSSLARMPGLLIEFAVLAVAEGLVLAWVQREMLRPTHRQTIAQ